MQEANQLFVPLLSFPTLVFGESWERGASLRTPNRWRALKDRPDGQLSIRFGEETNYNFAFATLLLLVV
jgi:hypothetical protein